MALSDKTVNGIMHYVMPSICVIEVGVIAAVAWSLGGWTWAAALVVIVLAIFLFAYAFCRASAVGDRYDFEDWERSDVHDGEGQAS